MSTLKVLILSTISSILLTSCALFKDEPATIQTEVHYTIPAKIAKPQPPVLEQLDKKLSLEHPKNFRILQSNMSNIKLYVKHLNSTIDYYETSIDKINRQIKEAQKNSMNK